MEKIIIIYLNVISVIPILAYPLVLFLSVMATDSFESKGFLSRIMWLSIILGILAYPLFIILCIVLSHSKDSLLWASIGLVPLVVGGIFFLYIKNY